MTQHHTPLNFELRTEFLVQLDGLTEGNEGSSTQILLVGATNLPSELDDAVLRRLTKRIYVPLPDDNARSALLGRALDTAIATHGSHGAQMNEREFATLVSKTDGFSGADLASLCQEAAMGPVRELGARIATASADEIRPINLGDFETALKAVRPSVDPSSLSKVSPRTTQSPLQLRRHEPPFALCATAPRHLGRICSS